MSSKSTKRLRPVVTPVNKPIVESYYKEQKLTPVSKQPLPKVPEPVLFVWEYYKEGIIPEFDEEEALFLLRHYGLITLEDARNYVRFKDRYGSVPTIKDANYYLPSPSSRQIEEQNPKYRTSKRKTDVNKQGCVC